MIAGAVLDRPQPFFAAQYKRIEEGGSSGTARVREVAFGMSFLAATLVAII